MSNGAIATFVVVLVIVGVTAYLVGTLVRAIQREKSTSMKMWKNFGLSLGFCFLFFVTWIAHGVAEWQSYTDEQRDHKEPVEVADFVTQFTRATLENWQSEFLQLFSFTVMAAVLIHKGSAESKDSDDRIEAALKRLEEKLDTEPVKHANATEKDLHVLPDEGQGWQLRRGDLTEPEGYYDVQQDAIDGGRELARKTGVQLHVHGTDGNVRATESPS